MPWRETNVMEERVRFVAQAERELINFSQVCREFGIARSTGYRWTKRYREAGSFSLLAEKSRRPSRSPGKTPEAIEARVVALRKRYGWGGKKLQVLLQREGVEIALWTINRILARQGLISEQDSHHPAPRRFERERPNELWQMDFKGEYPTGSGWCYPLSVVDDHSRYVVELSGLANQQGAGVHRCLVKAFAGSGVPEAMLMDHGTPWWSTTNGHGLTWVSVFLIKQGIRLYFSGVRHPQTQGKVERFHRTLKQGIRHRGKPATLAGYNELFVEFRMEYNEVRPHEALGMAVPASRYWPSPREYTPHPREWEYPPGMNIIRLNTQGCLDYGPRRYFVCEALAGEWVGVEVVKDTVLVSYRDMYVREIDTVLGRTRALVLPKTHP